jgi:hypothetical protein
MLGGMIRAGDESTEAGTLEKAAVDA